MNENNKKNSIKTGLTPWIICILLIVCILLVSVISFAKRNAGFSSDNASASDASETDADEGVVTQVTAEQITVKWQGKKYTGIYNGSFRNDKPFGEGTFVSDDEKLTYFGDWKEGVFHGSGKITYQDGSYETGSYEEGKRHGKIEEYKDENNYSIARYNKDTLYGEKTYYENGKEAKSKWYYRGKSLSKIEKNAIKLSSKALKDKSYVDKYIYIEGTVVFSGETEKKEYFRIKTDSIGMVIGSYYNQLGKYLKQANMPTMKAGDKVKIYGTLSKTAKSYCYADEEGFGHEYPEIVPVSGYVIDEHDSEDKLSDEYENLIRYPFSHYTKWVSGYYIVDSVMRTGKKVYVVSTPEGKEDKYVLFFNASESECLKNGDRIKISGYMDGQYKVLKEKENDNANNKKRYSDKNSGFEIDMEQVVYTYDYDVYPAIHISKWKKK